jgi:hypothetical protein
MDNKQNLKKYQSRSLQEYCIKVVEIKDSYIGNGWGWFVDLDLKSISKSKPIKIIQNYKSSQVHIERLNPIKEYPSIRSMKSMTNLHQMNNEINKLRVNHTNLYKYSNFICINLIGIITFTIIYYIID